MQDDFWSKLPKPFFALAPMEAVTDVVFRQVVARAGAPNVWFSEFTNATGWVHAGEKATGGRLIRTDDEEPIVAQIWGGEPGDMEQLATHCKELGFHGIDINMGCPARSAIKSGGSALILKPDIAVSSIQAAKTAELPVSVKTRLGYTRVDEWQNWLTTLLEQDIVNLTIHLRTKKEMSKVPAHHELIPEIVALRDRIAPKTLLTINGDIVNRQHGMELVQKYPGVDGVMIGRGVFSDPFCFANETAGNDFDSENGDSNNRQKLLDLLNYHLDLFDKWQPAIGRPYETLKRFFKVYIRNFDGASDLRNALMLTHNTEGARQIISNHLSSKVGVNREPVDIYYDNMGSSVKALIFDSDGTLLDTRRLILDGYRTVLKNHNLEHLANDQFIKSRLGKPTKETFDQILAGQETTLSSESLARELDSVQDQIAENIVAYPRTKELLEEWKNRGIKLCLFTSGYNYMIDRNFAAAGILNVRELFDEIISADDNIAHKPEPDAILELCKRTEVSPQNAVVIGDHAYDIIAGRRAGLGLKIGILHGIGTQHELLNAGADFLCDNLTSLSKLLIFSNQ